ncbi:MAG: hypothetical protein II802_04225 [Clostridia bacterium]|nr:hypothetical protein [Clostridia bacterium]
MFFTKEYRPRIGEFLNGGKFSFESLIDIMEDCGSLHSKSLGDSMIENGLAGLNWIIAEWNIKILRLPEYGEKLDITTWTRGKAPAVAIFREFRVKDKSGNICALGEAKVALFDFKEQKIVRISNEHFDAYRPENEVVVEAEGRLKEPSSYEEQINIFVRKADIDYNNHMHNTRYLGYAFEALSKEEYKNANFKSIRISYKNPVMYGTELTLKKHSDTEAIIIGMYSGDKLCNLVELR